MEDEQARCGAEDLQGHAASARSSPSRTGAGHVAGCVTCDLYNDFTLYLKELGWAVEAPPEFQEAKPGV
jgi:hypothetical protein